MFKRAITRRPGPNFASGITTASLGLPDYSLALRQHEAYCETLRSCGLEVLILDADPDYPDGCFVEDTAILAGEIAIITQPGHPARIGEQIRIAEILSDFMQIERITGEGRVDGGDILHCENHFFIGRSDRTNAEGARQLASVLSKHGYTSSEVPVAKGLHLKSSVSYIGNHMVVTPAYAKYFQDYTIIDTGEEEYGANCILVNGYVLFPAGFPETKAKLAVAGYHFVELEMSEFRKMDGALTCLSLLV